ncbi:hypothetical protein CRG98_016095, partial [Punica granatum]
GLGRSEGTTRATNSENSTRPLLVSGLWVSASSCSRLGLSPTDRRSKSRAGEVVVSVLIEGVEDLAELLDLVLNQLHRSSIVGSGPPRPESEIDREHKNTTPNDQPRGSTAGILEQGRHGRSLLLRSERKI